MPQGIEMVSVCTGLLGEEGRVSTSMDTRLQTEYLYLFTEQVLMQLDEMEVPDVWRV